MKKKNEPALREYGIEADKHWQHEVMKLAEKYGFIVQASGGVAMLVTHQNQVEQFGEAEYLRIQQMNGHCPKTFGYVLERFRTKRRDLYIAGFNLLDNINAKYRVKRVGKQSQYCDLEATFISDIFNELLTKGLIVTANTRNRTGFRTAKADEIPKEDKSA